MRNACAACSARSTETRNPASRIKAETIAHRSDRFVVDGSGLVFPVDEKIRQRCMALVLGGEQTESKS